MAGLSSVSDLPETPPYFYPCVPERVAHGAGTALRIGRDNFEGETLLLDSGDVVQFQCGNTKLINTSLDAFHESLILMAEALMARDKRLDTATSAELAKEAKALERKMRRVDPKAWELDVGTCWPFTVEEMGYGIS